MNYKTLYEEWLTDPYFDADTKAELESIRGDEKEIKERFYKDLEFGTGGLRGIIGAGINRVNVYTVRRATQALAAYIKLHKGEARGVAIAHDSRRMSPEFAREAALCLAANGIKAYIFESLRPTPELSFAVRYLGCIAGINVTASHNPPEYNGYKVYWEDGAQVTPPHDQGIMDQVKAIADFSQVRTMPLEEAQAAGLFQIIGSEVDEAYMAALKKRVLSPESIARCGQELKIVYSPLHGAGNVPVRRILRELGFTQVHVVKEQEEPDGNFPTVSYPNPETEEAFRLGTQLALEVGADLILATDPDSDRLGVHVWDRQGETYRVLTGNMSASLLADYELGRRQEKEGLPADGYIVKTIVSTNLMDAIAAFYKVELKEVLTGFKYIGREILHSEETHRGTYLFGMEESYGCLVGTYARDKDAVSAAMALCEAAAYYRERGMTLWDAMVALYDRLGYYQDGIQSVTLKGMDGLAKIQEIMATLRSTPPASIGGYRVVRVRDYQTGETKDLATGETRPTGLPASNVLYYEMGEDTWLAVRPSGTEPKIKFYYGVRGNSLEEAEGLCEAMGQQVLEMIGQML